MTKFNPKAARAKRPCPIWVDNFQRDTQHLEADEIGAYFLLLMAMWSRESCDFPDDDNRLARVCRVSPRLWKSRIGPVIRSFLKTDGKVVFQKRLREEASFVERQVKAQSDRKASEKSDNPLNFQDQVSSADTSMDEPPTHPSQQPNNLTEDDDDGGSARALACEGQLTPEITEPPTLTFRERILMAMGLDQSGLTGRGGNRVGTQADMLEARRWVADLRLTPSEILEVVAEATARATDRPSSFKYFNKPMQRFAAAKASAAEKLEPLPDPPSPYRNGYDQNPPLTAEKLLGMMNKREAELEAKRGQN